MTPRASPSNASQAGTKSRSKSPGNSRYRYEHVSSGIGTQADGPPSRRRPSRADQSARSSPHQDAPLCEGSVRGGSKRSKARRTLKRAPRRESLHIDTSVTTPEDQAVVPDESIERPPEVPQVPSVEAQRASSRSSSDASSSTASSSRRRRQTANHAIENADDIHPPPRRATVESARSSGTSLASALKASNQQSRASSESNSTVTPKSRAGSNQTSRGPPPPPQRRISPEAKAYHQPSVTMEDEPSDVFQFMHESMDPAQFSNEGPYGRPPVDETSGASSSGASHHEDEQSSSVEDCPLPVDSPMTSPASTRRSDPDMGRHPEYEYRPGAVPLYASSFVHGHSGRDDEHEGQSEEESEDASDAEHGDRDTPATDSGLPQSLALQKASPPRIPSVMSEQSDRHARRLRQKEQELANHVFQSPRPQKEFHFNAGSAASPYPTMPVYDHRVYPPASPPTSQATVWPPVASYPPQLPGGYAPMSPEAVHPMPAGSCLPMVPTGSSAPHHAQPYHQSLVPVLPYQAPVPAAHPARTMAVGYEGLADKLSEPTKTSGKRAAAIVPMYRKFEHLNHRVLLHLQDEICELEEKLRSVDDSIMQMSPRDETGHPYPASRRGDAQYGSEMHFNRISLLGNIFQKLNQYNQALSSFNGVLRELQPASTPDIQAYRAWMEKRTPIDHTESRFLERKHDLVAISRKAAVSTTRSTGHPSPAVWLPVVLVLPVVGFAVIPNLLGRLVVIAIIGVAEAKAVMATPELLNMLTVQEWGTAAAA